MKIGADRGLRQGMRGYAQRDSSLWKPIVEAITIWLVRDRACRCFGWYLSVLRGTEWGDGFCSGVG